MLPTRLVTNVLFVFPIRLLYPSFRYFGFVFVDFINLTLCENLIDRVFFTLGNYFFYFYDNSQDKSLPLQVGCPQRLYVKYTTPNHPFGGLRGILFFYLSFATILITSLHFLYFFYIFLSYYSPPAKRAGE